jgi:hypothetical protein
MKTKIIAICVFMLLASSFFISIPTTFAAVGQGDWITAYTIEDANSGQKLIEADFATSDTPNVLSPVIAGAQLKVTFTINVFTAGAGNLQLRTNMKKATGQSQFWQLVSDDYDLGSDYNPTQSATDFNWKEGTFEMICYGQVSQVTKPVNVILVGLYASGTTLDNINVTVLTTEGSDFQNLYDQYENRLVSLINSGVAPGYTQMYENVLNQSTIALLEAIPTSGEPAGSVLEMIMLPAIGVAAVAAVVFAFMFMRARGKNSYFRLVVEDQIKDLEGLTLRASKIDRTISSSLTSIEDRLKRLVGM